MSTELVIANSIPDHVYCMAGTLVTLKVTNCGLEERIGDGTEC